jgi:hypothetical protein
MCSGRVQSWGVEQKESYNILKEIIRDEELFHFHRPSFVIGDKDHQATLGGRRPVHVMEIAYHQLINMPDEI